WPVIPAIVRIFAPAVSEAYSLRRQRRDRTRMPVRAPPQPLEPEYTSRRSPIAFTFICLDAAFAQCHWQRERSSGQPAAPRVTRLATYCDPGQRSFLQYRRHLGLVRVRPKCQFTLALLPPNVLLRDNTNECPRFF